MEEANDKIQCICGSTILKKNQKKHEETAKHKKATGQVVEKKERKVKQSKNEIIEQDEPNEVEHPKLTAKEGWLVPPKAKDSKRRLQEEPESPEDHEREAYYSDSGSDDDNEPSQYDVAILDTHHKVIQVINMLTNLDLKVSAVYNRLPPATP
jgi:hypothetical protein